MKRLLVALVVLSFTGAVAEWSHADVPVKGHFRNGKWVKPHMRSNPDGNFRNNWSTKGNVNPYTGKRGWLTEPPERSGRTSGSTFGRATLEPKRTPARSAANAPRRNGAEPSAARRTGKLQVDPFLREAFGDAAAEQQPEKPDIALPPRVQPKSTTPRPEPRMVVRRGTSSDLSWYNEKLKEDEERRRWAVEFEQQRRGRGMTDPERHSLRTYGQRRW